MSFFSHFGKTELSLHYQLHIHDVTSLSCVEALQCVLQRNNKKSYTTRIVMSDGNSCHFDETLELTSTIYKKGEKYDKKLYTICVQTEKKRNSRMSMTPGTSVSASAASQSSGVLLSCEVDLAEMAQEKDFGKEITRVFPLKDLTTDTKRIGGVPAPMLKITFKVGPQGKRASTSTHANGDEEAAATTNVMSPIQPRKASLNSFSREFTPDQPVRQLKSGSSSHNGHDADLPIDTLGRGRAPSTKKNQYGEEVAHGSNGHQRSGEDEANKSYACDDEETSQPRRAPERAPTASPQLDEYTPDHKSSAVVSPVKSRRTETRIFNSIMIDAIVTPTAASAAASANASGTASPRKPSVLVQVPAPTDSRRTSVAAEHQTPRSPRRVLASGSVSERPPLTSPNKMNLHITTNEPDAITPNPNEPPMSYSYDIDPDTPLPPANKPSAAAVAASADDDESNSFDNTSFADRHAGLTVEDILSPGFGNDHAPGRASPNPAQRRKASHGRNISMFTNAATEGAQAVEEILRPSTTRSSAITKFFAAAKKISTNRTNNSGTDSQPSSAAATGQPSSSVSPRSPRIASSQSFTPQPTPSFPTAYSAAAETDTAAGSSSVRKSTDPLLYSSAPPLARTTSSQALDAVLADVAANSSIDPVRSSRDASTRQSRHHSRQQSVQSSLSSSPSRPAPTTSTVTNTPGSTLSAHSPRMTPARHSTAHTTHRASLSRASPAGSLREDDMAKHLATGVSPTAPVDGNVPEVGSYAAWKQLTKANRARASSRGSNGSNGGNQPFGTLQLSPASGPTPSQYTSATKSLPRPITLRHDRKISSLTREQSSALTANNSTPSTSSQFELDSIEPSISSSAGPHDPNAHFPLPPPMVMQPSPVKQSLWNSLKGGFKNSLPSSISSPGTPAPSNISATAPGPMASNR